MGGIALGADTRATEGSIVADKNCEKVRVWLCYPSFIMLLRVMAGLRVHLRIYIY